VLIHIVRVELGLRHVQEAAGHFVKLVGKEAERGGGNADAIGYTVWRLIEPAVERLTDDEVIRFADAVCSSGPPCPKLRAAMRLRQAQTMYERLLVQGGRRVLAEAIHLAYDARSAQLLQIALTEQLFTRVIQTYRNWNGWFGALVDALLKLTADFVPPDVRDNFARTIAEFLSRNSKSLAGVEGFTTAFEKNPFVAVVSAIATVAENHGVSTAALDSFRSGTNQPGSV